MNAPASTIVTVGTPCPRCGLPLTSILLVHQCVAVSITSRRGLSS